MPDLGKLQAHGQSSARLGPAIAYSDEMAGQITLSGSAVERYIPAPLEVSRRDIARTQWEMTCTGFGAMIGITAYGKGGAAVGGLAAYLWSRQHWPTGE